jgi:hypothetical protein
LIKESRYTASNGWHVASDDLVADDAAPGSAVVAIGWWTESDQKIWEVIFHNNPMQP